MSLSDSMQDKLVRTFDARYAARDEAERYGYLSHSAAGSMQTDGEELVFDLSRIARDVDAYGQTSTCHRSNYRRLREDFPDAFTHIAFMNVDVLAAFASDLDDDLAETLIGLAHDYPLYDEEDLSVLESEEINAAWDDYLAWDLRRELTEWEQDIFDSMDADELREAFYSGLTELDYYPEHDGLDIRWDEAKCLAALRAVLVPMVAGQSA